LINEEIWDHQEPKAKSKFHKSNTTNTKRASARLLKKDTDASGMTMMKRATLSEDRSDEDENIQDSIVMETRTPEITVSNQD
jgi:hypothetical protein